MNDEFDQALSGRLRKLSGMPVDTSSLDRKLRAAIPPVEASASSSDIIPARDPLWWKPAKAAVAASLLVGILIAVILSLSTSQSAMAQPASMAALHRDLIAGKGEVPRMRVRTVAEAVALLTRTTDDPGSLAQLPPDQRMACCMRQVEGDRLACVILDDGTSPPISLVASSAASSHDMTHTHKVEDINMVMSTFKGRSLCIMSQASEAKLHEVLAGLQK